jgi:hypothetical protein
LSKAEAPPQFVALPPGPRIGLDPSCSVRPPRIIPGIAVPAGEAQPLDIVAKIVDAVREQRLAAVRIVILTAPKAPCPPPPPAERVAERVIELEETAGDPAQLVVQRFPLELQFLGILNGIVDPACLLPGRRYSGSEAERREVVGRQLLEDARRGDVLERQIVADDPR